MSESGSKNCPKVTFDNSTLRVGLKAPGWTGTVPDLTKKIVATVTPKSKLSKVSFSIDNSARASYTKDNEEEVGDSVKITFTITGLAATPDGQPTGDASFQAKCSGKVLASCKILVVVPRSQTHAVAAPTIANTCFVSTLFGFTQLSTKCTAIVTITIKDQFNVVLDPIYDNTPVDEIFINTTQNGFFYGNLTTVWVTINIPTGDVLTAGVKLDETFLGRMIQIQGLTLTPAQQASWNAGTLTIGGIDNTMQGKAGGVTGTQKIRVAGWELTNTYDRNMQATGGAYGPPVPYTATDT